MKIEVDKTAKLIEYDTRTYRTNNVGKRLRIVNTHLFEGTSPEKHPTPVYALYSKKQAEEIQKLSETHPVLMFGVKKRLHCRDSMNFDVPQPFWQIVPKERGKNPLYDGEYQWFLWKGIFYVTKDRLEPADVEALLLEKDNRRRLRLEKAHAVMAMNKQLDTKGERQPIPKEVKILVWRRDSARCVECGSQKELEFDHIIPLAMGGSNTERNLQLLCAVCNRRKGATLG